MKKLRTAQLIVILLASMVGIATAQSGVDWQAIKQINPQTRIRVETRERTRCYFEYATEDTLTCFRDRAGMWKQEARALSRVVYRREEVRAVHLDLDDDSAGYRALILAAGAGGGWDSTQSPTAFAGVKIGGPVTLNLGYDRLQGHSGFTTEGAMVLPLFRVPPFERYVLPGTPNKPEGRFLRLYAEPGMGYRTGGGKFGGYTSAGMLFLLFPDDRQQPYVEVERRFPFNDPMQGDTRISVGFMISLCEHCDFD
jgi:hypothetical protein